MPLYPSQFYPVEVLYRPTAFLRMRPHTRRNYLQKNNVVYAEAHGVGLVMDVFQPAGKRTGCGVVDVVSGGWLADRVSLNEHIGFGLIDALCERGITVFAISPGSITLFTGLEMVRHVQAAIRHIKHHAEDYHINPDRLGITGVSSGGHLAALAALAPQKGRAMAHDPLRKWSTDVSAAAVFFPPTDLVDYNGYRFDRFHIEGLEPARLLFHEGVSGKSETEIMEKLTALSPSRLPVHNPPPFMIVQGKADPVVPWEQAEKLAGSLRAGGGETCVLYNETGGHVWPDIHREVEDAAAWLSSKIGSPVQE